MEEGILVLEDGTLFRGRAFGALDATCGEVVFNTSLTGYQEILTDPSYAGQIITMTMPQIGNTGINTLDAEARQPFARGLIVRDLSVSVSSWRAEEKLETWMQRHGLFGLSGPDTRALTRQLRSGGTLRGILAAGAEARDVPALLERVKASPSMTGADLAREVTCNAPYTWQEPELAPWLGGTGSSRALLQSLAQARCSDTPPKIFEVVALDFGIKRSILRQLASHGCRVTVVPADTSADAILERRPDGVFLSNGPGDPEAVTYAIETTRKLLGKLPLFGICLGHQLLGLALGGSTFKLKFGHRGGNHPVQDLRTGKVAITSQNHGFAVLPSSLPAGVELTHLNLNDQTCEGLEHADLRAFSIQYHPEAGPGPHDAFEHFGRFRALMERSG